MILTITSSCFGISGAEQAHEFCTPQDSIFHQAVNMYCLFSDDTIWYKLRFQILTDILSNRVLRWDVPSDLMTQGGGLHSGEHVQDVSLSKKLDTPGRRLEGLCLPAECKNSKTSCMRACMRLMQTS